MPGGRPTTYSEQVVQQARDYIENYDKEPHNHAFPSVVGLCSAINRPKSTIYDWSKDPSKEFSDILATIHEKQELVTFNKAMTGEYNATIAKLLLGKHGYHDKQDTNTTHDLGPNAKRELSKTELAARLLGILESAATSGSHGSSN